MPSHNKNADLKWKTKRNKLTMRNKTKQDQVRVEWKWSTKHNGKAALIIIIKSRLIVCCLFLFSKIQDPSLPCFMLNILSTNIPLYRNIFQISKKKKIFYKWSLIIGLKEYYSHFEPLRATGKLIHWYYALCRVACVYVIFQYCCWWLLIVVDDDVAVEMKYLLYSFIVTVKGKLK